MSLKDKLESLAPEEQDQLIYAFNHGLSQHVRLPGDKFIGVNVSTVKRFKVIDKAGDWAYGDIE